MVLVEIVKRCVVRLEKSHQRIKASKEYDCQTISKYAITILDSLFHYSSVLLFSCLSNAPNIISNKRNFVLGTFN